MKVSNNKILKSSLYIITGTSRGLGEALVKEILSLKKNDKILSIGRRLNEDQKKYREINPTQFYFAEADLASTTEITKGLQLYKDEMDKVERLIFINNAGTISPIEKIGAFDEKELIESINVNAIAPAVLTNYILQHYYSKELIFLNITSGAAQKPIVGWAPYSSGKAYMRMFFSILQEQVKSDSHIKVLQIDPGVMDTGMQFEIRSSSPEAFPKHSDFEEFKQTGKLKTASESAKKILDELNSR